MSTFVWKRAHTASRPADRRGAGRGDRDRRDGDPGRAVDSVDPSRRDGRRRTVRRPRRAVDHEPPKAKPVDPLTGGRVSEQPGDRGQGGEHRRRPAAGRAEPGRHRLRPGGRGRADPAGRGLPLELPTPARSGPQRADHRRPAAAAVRQARPGLLRCQRPGAAQDRRGLDRADLPRSTRDNRRVAPHNVFVDLRQDRPDREARARPGSIGWTFAAKTEAERRQGRHGRPRVGNDTLPVRLRQGPVHRALARRSATPTATPARSPGPTTW